MNALDKLGLAIANAGYTWTPEMREAYENGVKEFETIRAEALEEAAKVCEKAMIQMNYSEAPYKQCAAAIRARGDKHD